MNTSKNKKSDSISRRISKFKFGKFDDYIYKSLKSGFLGFILFLLIIGFVHLFSAMTGIGKNSGVDIPDFLLAGIGFFLPFSVTLIKCIIE